MDAALRAETHRRRPDHWWVSARCAVLSSRAEHGASTHPTAQDGRAQDAFNAAITLSGVYGIERRRTPTASNTALEIADGTTAADGSPAPHGRSVGRSIRSMTMSGTSGIFRIG